MVLEETKFIMNMLVTEYPHSFKDLTESQMKAKLTLWHETFKNYPKDIVIKAVMNIISNSSNEDYAPNVAKINNEIKNILFPDLDVRASKAFDNMKKYIRCMTMTKSIDGESYSKLDSITQKMYSYSQLVDMVNISSDTLEYRRTEFIRTYKKLFTSNADNFLKTGNIQEYLTKQKVKQIPQQSKPKLTTAFGEEAKRLTENTIKEIERDRSLELRKLSTAKCLDA